MPEFLHGFNSGLNSRLTSTLLVVEVFLRSVFRRSKDRDRRLWKNIAATVFHSCESDAWLRKLSGIPPQETTHVGYQPLKYLYPMGQQENPQRRKQKAWLHRCPAGWTFQTSPSLQPSQKTGVFLWSLDPWKPERANTEAFGRGWGWGESMIIMWN